MSEETKSGDVVGCSYTASVGYDGKKPFLAYTPTMKVEIKPTPEETKSAAIIASQEQIEIMWKEHFPDGTECPKVQEILLGHLVAYVDDYEWRRGY